MAIQPRNLKLYGVRDLEGMPQVRRISAPHREGMRAVAQVLPFRTNNYVIEELIDWSQIPEDPIFQLTFPQPGMLAPRHFERMMVAMRAGFDRERLRRLANEIRMELNPHPAGQMSLNVPYLDDEPVPGVQRKYRETCLVFPSRGQTCHAYCTFCFRWAQFVGMADLKFATDEAGRFADFVRREKDLTDVLITGGDPLVMKADMLARYVERFLGPGFEHIQTLRIGTKSLSYWPFRFLTDPDADDLLRLFERVTDSGKHLALMAHYNHWRELETEAAQAAVRRVRSTGAQIRTQSPVLRHINDRVDVWARMWTTQVRLGMVPYYMFIERDTGASHYFELPLARCHEIFQGALRDVSGLARTARGPSMSTTPGKVVIDGIADIHGDEVFVCSFIQARNPEWVKRPFFAKFDPSATWLDDLVPAWGESAFFFEPGLRALSGAGPTTSPGEPRHERPAEIAAPRRVQEGPGLRVVH